MKLGASGSIAMWLAALLLSCAGRRWIPGTLGTQFTCFTGTEVQILTQLLEAPQEVAGLQEE